MNNTPSLIGCYLLPWITITQSVSPDFAVRGAVSLACSPYNPERFNLRIRARPEFQATEFHATLRDE